jgi:hypothetical protein
MLCPYCNINNIRHLKVHILNPIGAGKKLCLQCKQKFIKHTEYNQNDNLTQCKNVNNTNS